MKRLILIPFLALAACTTTGEKLAGMSARSVSDTAQTPRAVVTCIAARTPGLYTPTVIEGDEGLVVTWMQDPIGHVASFTIKSSGGKTSVEVRSIAPIRKQIAKVEGCY